MSQILGNMEGQKKVLLYIGEGISYNMEDFYRGESSDMVRFDMRRAVGSAGLANVSFYTLDARGLSDGQDIIFTFSGCSPRERPSVKSFAPGPGHRAAPPPCSSAGEEQAQRGGDAAQSRHIEMLMNRLDIESMAFADEARRSHDNLRYLACRRPWVSPRSTTTTSRKGCVGS